MNERTLIEVDFPLKEVSEESVREMNIRHGHISTLHTWWARKPVTVSRAAIYAALMSGLTDDASLRTKLEFLSKLSKFESSSNKQIMEKARGDIRGSFNGRAPRILDCFAGGGAIPLESLRLGCETYATELNPVAVLILKAILEYPQKWGAETKASALGSYITNRLAEDVRKWGELVYKRVNGEIGHFYPAGSDGKIPVGYIWTRTVGCQNPLCRAEIPLIRQLWLDKRTNNLALKPVVDKNNRRVDFELTNIKQGDFDPSQGTARMGTAICPVCDAGLSAEAIRKEAMRGRLGHRLVAVVLHDPKKTGKTFRIGTPRDIEVFKNAESYLQHQLQDPRISNLVPDEPIPTPDGGRASEGGSFWVHLQQVLYGMFTWGDLFNARQKLALVTFAEKIRDLYVELIAAKYEPEYAKAIVTYLAFALDRLAASLCVLARWRPDTVSIERAFDRTGVPGMIWGYGEANPFGGVRGEWSTESICKVIEQCTQATNVEGNVGQASATNLPYPDRYFDAIITDPPYYDAVPYSDLSDFFYVWLKRIVGDLYPELFSTPLTPRVLEIMQNDSLVRRGPSASSALPKPIGIKGKDAFENDLMKSFMEIHRVLNDEGIVVLVFAHKSTEAWETVIKALLKSGFFLTTSWPIHTELRTRLRALESAVLASSIFMVCRKRVKEEVGYFNEVKEEIERRVKEKLEQFWEQGISGADFFVSATGPAVEVFGRYSLVEKLSGEEVSVKELLEYVRKVVGEFALGRILKRPDLGGLDATTRYYLLWRWTFGNAKVHFDDARKLSQSAGGVELTEMWSGPGLVRKEKEFVRVLGPKDRVLSGREKPNTMIDALHQAVLLWEKGDRKKLQEMLEEAGYLRNEVFWQTAQAISEVLPEGDKEKQLIQGLLYGKDTYVKGRPTESSTLLDYIKGETKE